MPGTVRLTDAQIAGVAKKAGFTGNALSMAVAIALAESSGYADNHNPIPPDDSYGLWQINMLGAMGPERRKRFNLKSNTDLYNPDTNARVAYAMSNGGKNWGAWATYTGGKYLGYLPRARKAAGNPDTSGNYPSGGGVEQAGAGNPLSWPGEIVDLFKFLANPITWERAGMLVAGGLFLVFALAGMAAGGGGIQKMAGIATDLIPQTRAIKAAAKVA